MPHSRVPEVAVKRLPVYLRVLQEAQAESVDVISSSELSDLTGISSEQIRKDLAYFGAFGTRGVGYSTDVLAERIQRILGLYRTVPVAMVGAGHLGTALARHNLSNEKSSVRITAIFDQDPEKQGREISGVVIRSAADIKDVIVREGIKLAVLAIPADAAQDVAEVLVDAGVRAILNFSPAKLNLPVYVQNIDLTLELQTLAYYTMGNGHARG